MMLRTSVGVVAVLAFGVADAQTMCDDPAGSCGRLVPAQCTQKLAAGAIASDDDAACGPAFETYRECLAMVTQSCGGAPTAPKATAAGERPITRVGPNDAVEVALDGCRIAGESGAACDLVFRATAGADVSIEVLSGNGEGRIVTAEGVPVAAAEIASGDRSTSYDIDTTLVDGVPWRVRLTHRAAARPLRAGEVVPLLEADANVGGDRVSIRFRDVTIE